MSRLFTNAVGRAAGIFHTIEQSGGPIPSGPVLVVANHPNSLLDPLVIFRVAGRPTRPLAKAPLFDQKILGAMLRLLGGLPVYRQQDDPAQMHRNADTFRGAIAALRAGDAVQIYPEGKSHSEPSLLPMRTGAARIAIGAEQESDWRLGLQIVPVGLTYERKSLFRGRVLAVVGSPFVAADLREVHERDPAQAVRTLTDRITERLNRVTLNVEEHRDSALIDTAERLYAREKQLTGFRERDKLADRLPRLRRFARGLKWLRESDAERHDRLTRSVEVYRRRAQLLGAREGDVPPRYELLHTLRYSFVNAVVLLLLLPLAVVGTVLWYPAYLAPRLTLRLMRLDHESIATYKIATAFVVVPLTLLVLIVAGWLVARWSGVLLAAISAPVAGLVAIYWHERWQQVHEDVRLFFRVLFRADHRERLALDRAALVAEFDAVAEESGVGN